MSNQVSTGVLSITASTQNNLDVILTGLGNNESIGARFGGLHIFWPHGYRFYIKQGQTITSNGLTLTISGHFEIVYGEYSVTLYTRDINLGTIEGYIKIDGLKR